MSIDSTVIVEGKHVPGFGVGAQYVAHPYYSTVFRELLGCTPYPGTLNLETSTDWRELASNCKPILVPETLWDGRRLGAVYAWEAYLEQDGRLLRVLLIRPLLSRHKPEVLELIACTRLQGEIVAGGVVQVRVACKPG